MSGNITLVENQCIANRLIGLGRKSWVGRAGQDELGRTSWAGRAGQDELGRTSWAG